ncbi:MAG: glycosyltransferase family 4 protein [Blastocatellia bacterium]|nr:glycosyltransferase family 4 protein [Blastocatellia bacterium]
MRIIVTTYLSAKIGGVETYIERLLEMLVEAGHDVFVVFDVSHKPGTPSIAVPKGVPAYHLQSAGLESVIEELNAIDGAVVLANSLDSMLYTVGRRIRHAIAFYAHTYVGSCITGMRINRLPSPSPCEREFGPAWLLNYFPRRCGGLSPLTMIRSYRQQVERRRTLPHVDLVIANSDAVARQFSTAGVAAETLHPVLDTVGGVARTEFRRADARSLVFVSRFEDYKGGEQLLESLPTVASLAGMPVRLTMVGEGSQRYAWERQAERLTAKDSRLSVRFTGWLGSDGIAEVLEDSDVIVVPSVWPEPFGLVGLEAARLGIPSAAFSVGGIPEWLSDGVNGHLADGRDCSPQDLAAAVVRCVSDLAHFRKLSEGAVQRRASFSPEAHLRRLEALLHATAALRAKHC